MDAEALLKIHPLSGKSKKKCSKMFQNVSDRINQYETKQNNLKQNVSDNKPPFSEPFQHFIA